MLCLFLTKMLVTMTPHFWQQTDNYITEKLGKNVAIKVLIPGWRNPAFLTKFLTKSVFWWRNYIDYPFMWCQNFICMFFRFALKHACDGQTDGQNYDPQDRASIAALRGKNDTFGGKILWSLDTGHCVTRCTCLLPTWLLQQRGLDRLE